MPLGILPVRNMKASEEEIVFELEQVRNRAHLRRLRRRERGDKHRAICKDEVLHSQRFPFSLDPRVDYYVVKRCEEWRQMQAYNSFLGKSMLTTIFLYHKPKAN